MCGIGETMVIVPVMKEKALGGGRKKTPDGGGQSGEGVRNSVISQAVSPMAVRTQKPTRFSLLLQEG